MTELLAALWAGTAGVVLNITIGLATGLVSGLAVARAARFGHIKHRLHQLIRNWEFFGEDVKEFVDCAQMRDIGSELAFLGHRSACEFVLAACKEVDRRQQRMSPHEPSSSWPSTLMELDAFLQMRFRELRPNWGAILLNGRL